MVTQSVWSQQAFSLAMTVIVGGSAFVFTLSLLYWLDRGLARLRRRRLMAAWRERGHRWV